MNEVKQKKTHAAITQGGSALARYRNVIVGRQGWGALLYYEFCVWLGVIPGALGLVLRRLFWPRLFRACGRGVMFGARITLRHPHRVELGNNVVVSDGCILDARNDALDCVISIGDDCILSNDVMLSCKQGSISIGARGGIGAQTIIHSVNNATVYIGNDLIMGPRCYLAGGGNYNIDRLDVPMAQQGMREGGRVTLGDDVWLGANVCILPGVSIAKSCVIGAGSVVTRDVVARSICAGVPAKVIATR